MKTNAQFELFPPASKSSDPITSDMAEERFTRSGKRQGHCRLILDWMRFKQRDWTTAELATWITELDRYAIARRMVDLERQGRIQRAGRRICLVKGTEAQAWKYKGQ